MTLNEVHILMEELNRHISDQTRVLFGTAVDPGLGQKIGVTLLSALQGPVPAPMELKPRPMTRVESSPVSAPPSPPVSVPVAEPYIVPRVAEPEPEPVLLEPAPIILAPVVAAEAAPLFAEPEPEPEPARTPPPMPKPAKIKPAAAKQEQMQFEPVTRGRFEKSEPTIVDGQDLDVPTFLRRNVKVR